MLINIPAADLEGRVLGGLQRLLIGNEALLQVFADEFRRELERLRGARPKDEGKVRRELAEAERGIARCLGFILSGDGAPASVRTKLQELEESKARLEGELAKLNEAAPAPVEIHPNVPDLYRRRVAALAELLEDETTRPEAMDAIRSLVDCIEVGPPEAERGPCTVTLIGALASVLTFVSEQEDVAGAGKHTVQQGGRTTRGSGSAFPKPAGAKQKSPPLQGGSLGTSLVVAGAGFEPAAFRL